MDDIISEAQRAIRANLTASADSTSGADAVAFANAAGIAFNVLVAAKEMQNIDNALNGGEDDGGEGDEVEPSVATDPAATNGAREIILQ